MLSKLQGLKRKQIKKPKKNQKNPKKPKKTNKTQKNPLGWVFLKNPGFFPTLSISECFKLYYQPF